jgi:aspartate/methionine/tyrosine aminotransferase
MKNTEDLISDRVRTVSPPQMTAFFNLPPNVISLGLGEPGFSPPPSIRQGGIDAITAGQAPYPPSKGYEALRERVAEYLRERFDFSYTKEEVLITSGASIALML